MPYITDNNGINNELRREINETNITLNYLMNLYNLNSINEEKNIIIENNTYQISNVYVNTQHLPSN